MGRSAQPDQTSNVSKGEPEPPIGQGPGSGPAMLLSRIGALGWTLGLGILASFFVFAALDGYLTLNGEQQRLKMGARLLANEINRSPDANPEPLAEEVRDLLGDSAMVVLRDRDGQVTHLAGPAHASAEGRLMAANFEQQTAESSWGSVTVQRDRVAIFTPVALRATAGTGLIAVLLLIGLVVLRRQLGKLPRPSDLFEAIHDGVACWGRDGRLLTANRGFKRLVQQHARTNDALDARDRLLNAMAGSGELRPLGEQDGRRRYSLTLANGEHHAIEEHQLTDGRCITVARNETRLSQLQSRLRTLETELRRMTRLSSEHKMRGDAASRSKTRFLAHLNHELRTPLNHIIGFADLMAHQNYGPLGDKRYLTYTQHIKQSGETLLAALSSMLELAEFNSGEQPFKCVPVPLDELMGWCGERFSAQARRAGVMLQIGSGEGMMLSGDRHLLQRMVGIILDNALRYTPQGGRVSLSCWTASDGVVLEITDTGVGIAPEQQEQLNQSFVLGEKAFMLRSGGGGLGVPIARAIAELSGGEMVINSTPAIGTTVAISLPLGESQSHNTRAA